MAEYINRIAYCKEYCLCHGGECDKASCPIFKFPAADVAPVVHGRCPVCSGQEVLAQDCDNGYSVEIDAESQEMTLWNGDTCLAAISIDFCPNCGARMDGDAHAPD